MYENIGEKIKSLAKAFCVIEAIAAAMTGVSLMAEDLLGIGLLVMFAGPLVAWVSSWLIYGFGQLVENSEVLVEQGRKKSINQIIYAPTKQKTYDSHATSTDTSNDTPTAAPTHKWRCSNCGNI